MTFDIELRPLRASDLDRVLQLEQALFGLGAWSYAMLAEELGGPGRWYRAATIKELGSIGPAPLAGYSGLWFDGEDAQIMTIGVAPAYQRRGIGALLLTELIEQANRMGARAVLLEVAVNNAGAIGMYQKFGFEQLAVRKRYYQPEGLDAYVMRYQFKAEPIEPEPES